MQTDPNPKSTPYTSPAPGIPSEQPATDMGSGNQEQVGSSDGGIGTGEYESNEPRWDAEKNPEYDQ